MPRSRNPASSPLSPRATAWQAAASAPKRSEMLAAGSAASCARVVTPSRCKVTARSGRASVATDQGPRKSAVPPDGTISPERAASMAAKSPSATPMVASSPTMPARRATTASSPPKKRAGPRAGSVPTPRRTGWTHGQSSPARSSTRANRRASSPFAPSSRSSGHQMTTNRSTSSSPPLRLLVSGRLRPVTGAGPRRPAPRHSGPAPLSGPGRLSSASSTAPEPAGSQSEHSLTRPAARRPLTRTSARRRRRCPWPWPTPSHSTAPTASARSPPSGQAAGPSSRTTRAAWRSRARAVRWRAAVRRARPGGRTRTASTPERRSPAASAHPLPGWGTKTTRRRSSPSPAAATTPGSGRPTAAHQLPAADAAARSARARVVAPWPGGPRHRGGRAPAQGAGREERGQGRGHRQGPPGHRRGGTDPVGQPGGELPGTGGRRVTGNESEHMFVP